jgi:hypothetical protein
MVDSPRRFRWKSTALFGHHKGANRSRLERDEAAITPPRSLL